MGTGFLSFTLTWSRSGDGDIVVQTSENKIIYFGDKGPSVNTSHAQLDVDDKTGTGPENVFLAKQWYIAADRRLPCMFFPIQL